MSLHIELPEDDGLTLLLFLKEKFGFTEIDHCELQRPDRARVSYGPSEPRTDSGYTIDPFPRPDDLTDDQTQAYAQEAERGYDVSELRPRRPRQ